MEEHESDHKKAKLMINGQVDGNITRDDAHHKRNHKLRSNRQKNNNPDVQLSKSLSWLLRHTAPSLGLHPTPEGYLPVDDILSLNHPRFRNGNGAKYTIEDVTRIVETSDKQRFRLEYIDLTGKSTGNQDLLAKNDDHVFNTNVSPNLKRKENLTLCIRANQGHSYKNIIDSHKLLTPLTDEELSDQSLNIIHGTTRKAWEDHIRIEGLSRMKRNHIHFATGLPDGTNKTNEKKNVTPLSGMRSTSQIYIYIDGKKCATDNIKFFRSDNGVILTAGENDDGLLHVKYFKKVVLASTGKILLDGEG